MIKSNAKPEILKAGTAIVGLVLGGYFAYDSYKGYQVKVHPTREFAEIILKLDKRVTNFCGRKYRVKNYYMVNNDENFSTYRIKLEGMRGKCSVLVKCQKHSHAELKSHSQEQMVYSKKTKDQKASSPFVPYNYTDVLIPTQDTFNKMKEILQTKNLEDELLEFQRDKYINGDYHNFKNAALKALRKPIENADTFYRITSLVMVANDNLVFNIRPIGPKYRNYDIEDTIYTSKTYEDVVKKIMTYRFMFSDMLKEDFSAEEYRNEIILQKQANFVERTEKRKLIFFVNGGLLLIGYFINKLYFRQKIDITSIKSLQSKVNALGPKAGLGSTKRLICIDYKYSPFNYRFNINGFVMGENGVTKGIETYSYVDDVKPHGSVTMFNLKDESKGLKENAQVKVQI